MSGSHRHSVVDTLIHTLRIARHGCRDAMASAYVVQRYKKNTSRASFSVVFSLHPPVTTPPSRRQLVMRPVGRTSGCISAEVPSALPPSFPSLRGCGQKQAHGSAWRRFLTVAPLLWITASSWLSSRKSLFLTVVKREVEAGSCYFHNIRREPAVIRSAPMITFGLAGSFRRTKARMMVMTTLSLSIGATRETSPVCNALK